MALDSVVPIALDASKYVVVPIKRRLGYVFFSESYAQDLLKEVRLLGYQLEIVRNEMEVARNNRRNVYRHVTQWEENAERALREAHYLLAEFEGAAKTCCYVSLPEHKRRYQFSRKANAKIEGIQCLTQEYSQIKDISFSGPPPGHVDARTMPWREDKHVVQSAMIVQEVMAALFDDSNSVVGIHGMGEVSMSTLLVDIERRIREEKLFDWIAKAEVSENPDIKRIQGEIADALGLGVIKDRETVNGRANVLCERLEYEERTKRRVLIILDNLWERLDLKSVGIPCGHDNKVIGCKLLLTSKFQDLLRKEMCCDSDFCLSQPKEEERNRFFQEC